MSLASEFKTFVSRGNMLDLAVAVIIGGAFGAITTSLVNDVLMPPMGIVIGNVDFSKLAITLKPAVGDQPAVVVAYGKFIQTVINFLIIAFAVFMIVKAFNKMKKKEAAAPAPPAEPSDEVKLLTEIRDALKNRN